MSRIPKIARVEVLDGRRECLRTFPLDLREERLALRPISQRFCGVAALHHLQQKRLWRGRSASGLPRLLQVEASELDEVGGPGRPIPQNLIGLVE